MTSDSEQRSAFSLITRGPFSRLWWASLISSTGDWITIFATIAVADDIAGGTGTLIAIFSRIVPGLFFGALAGVITDRVDRRKLIVIADLGRALLVPFLALATNLPVLVMINLGLEFLSLLGQSPRAAVVPRLVRKVNIVTANSLILGATYGTVPVGAAFNWILTALPHLSFWGAVPARNEPFALAFMVDSATFLASGLIILSLPTMRAKIVQRRVDGDVRQAAADPQSSWADLLDGARFLWRAKEVRRVIVGLTTALFGGGTIIVLGKPFVEDVLNANATGFFAVVTTLGIGAGIGIGFVSLYSTHLPQRDLVFGVSMTVAGFGLAAAALTSTVFGASAWILVMGLGAGAAYVMGFTFLHEQVDDDMRGRVFSSMFALMRIGLFVSMAVAVPLQGILGQANLGVISERPTRSVLFAGGATIVISGVGILWALRGLLGRPALGETTRTIFEEAARASQVRPARAEDDDVEADEP